MVALLSTRREECPKVVVHPLDERSEPIVFIEISLNVICTDRDENSEDATY